jgi:hypothetical protein
MERKLEKRCSVTELEVNKRYAIGINGRYPFIVNSINYDRGFVLLTYTDSSGNGLLYLNSEGYYYEFPLSSLEKELM